MPKQSPVPSEVDKPFYDAANDEQLVIQFCGACQLDSHLEIAYSGILFTQCVMKVGNHDVQSAGGN